MKSYNHLYEVCVSEGNRREAIRLAKKSGRIRKIIKRRHLSDDVLLAKSLEWINNYETFPHNPIKILDGARQKERTILVPSLEELVVQHCVVNALKPMFWHGMYEHSYASLPGRGAHKAKKLIEKWIRHDSKNVKYVLKMDIRHFFDSIPHEILKEKLAKTIHDEKMLYLLGRTNAQTQKAKLQAACNYTGLSDKAVNILTELKEKNPQQLKTVNFLLEQAAGDMDIVYPLDDTDNYDGSILNAVVRYICRYKGYDDYLMDALSSADEGITSGIMNALQQLVLNQAVTAIKKGVRGMVDYYYQQVQIEE